jgi:hypothetical protein
MVEDQDNKLATPRATPGTYDYKSSQSCSRVEKTYASRIGRTSQKLSLGQLLLSHRRGGWILIIFVFLKTTTISAASLSHTQRGCPGMWMQSALDIMDICNNHIRASSFQLYGLMVALVQCRRWQSLYDYAPILSRPTSKVSSFPLHAEDLGSHTNMGRAQMS